MTVYSLPRHRAAQSMEPGRDPAAMVWRPKKKAFRVLLPPSSGPPARIPALPPKTYFKVSWVLFDSSRF